MRIRNLLAIAAIVALAGCKIVIEVPEGGSVVTDSGAYECESGETCVVDVVDLFFDEEFIGEPAPGWTFVEWAKVHRGLCGSNSEPCRLFTSAFEGNEILMSFLDNAEEEFLLTPVFEQGDGAASVCEYTQSTPGGDFEVCHVHPEMDTDSCSALGGALSSRDCSTGAVGYCSTDDGDIYYFEGDPGLLETGCGFAPGVWTTL